MIWVSSVLDRQILACRSTCRPIATLPGGLSPLGIAWDWSRDLIWIAADCPDLPGIPRCAHGALIALDPRGKVVANLAPAGPFHPGDVSVSLRAVFVSDGRNGLVYGLLPRRRGLRPINRMGDGRSAQGTAISPDGTSVIVADYSRGIGRIDLRTGMTIWFGRSNGRVLSGIDGLVRCGDRYFGVNNSSTPGRVLSMTVHAGEIDAHELAAGPQILDPTQIAFDGKRLLVVANSGWQRVAKIRSMRPSGATIVEIALPDGCNS